MLNILLIILYAISILYLLKGLTDLGISGDYTLRAKGLNRVRVGGVSWIISSILLVIRISFWFSIPLIIAVFICIVLFILDSRGH